MDKALQKVSQFFDKYTTQVLRSHFERVREMPRANRILKRIASASDRDQLEDYLAEVRYALVFAGLEFQVEIEPVGKRGPDLGISRDGHQAFVETMRFRKIYPGPPVLDLADETATLPEYGDPPRDIRKAFEKILTKFRQVGNGEAIIAIWNDDEDMEEVEVETAVLDLRNDAVHNILSLPSGLLFVLYGSKWVRAGDNKQLYCFPLRYPGLRHQIIWQNELDSCTVGELIPRALTRPRNSIASHATGRTTA